MTFSPPREIFTECSRESGPNAAAAGADAGGGADANGAEATNVTSKTASASTSLALNVSVASANQDAFSGTKQTNDRQACGCMHGSKRCTMVGPGFCKERNHGFLNKIGEM